MASSRDLKNKVLKTAKKTAKQTAETAKMGLDQVLLALEHPAVKKMADKVASPENKDMVAKLSHKILEQASAIRATLDPAVLKPMADIVTEEVKTQIKAVKKDPAGSVVKATQAGVVAGKAAMKVASKTASKAASGARSFGKRTASSVAKAAAGKKNSSKKH